MKPVYLEFCGINSFSERAEINFRELLEFGIFGIFGDTGSGKSTVLDCISFALYGKVSRLDAKEATIVNLINYRADRAFVNFEFEIVHRGKRRIYRVERELKRKNGTQNVRVSEKTEEGGYLALAEGARDGNALLESIVGLEQKDFEKCIALPQGEFAQFVKAQKADRLKLVSRLFNLEGYGESLVRRTNERYRNAKAGEELVKAKAEPYESITEDKITELKEKIVQLRAEEQDAEARLLAAREKEKQISALAEKKREADRLAREMEKLESARAEMAAQNSELSRLEHTPAVFAAAKEHAAATQKRKDAEAALAAAAQRLRGAEEQNEKISAWDFERADSGIQRLTEAAANARSSEADRKTAKDAEKRLAEIQSDFQAELERYKDFSYEREKAALEKRLDSLGGDFFTFAEEHGKAGLLRSEYAVFHRELTVLAAKHPAIQVDAEPLIIKYAELSAGEKTEFSQIRSEFEARAKEREEVQKQLNRLETVKGKYEVHLSYLQQLETERARVKAQLDELTPRLSAETAPYAELVKRLEALREEQRGNVKRREELSRMHAEANAAHAAAAEAQRAAAERLAEAETRLRESLEAGGFGNLHEAEALGKKYGDPAVARKRVETYKETYAATKSRLRELSKEDYSIAGEAQLSAAKEALRLADVQSKECARQTALCQSELARMQDGLEKKRALQKELREKRKEAELLERLKKLLEGNKFMEFVAEEYLQTVATNASGRLLTLTDGRYFLRYDGGFFVGDNFNGGALRGVYTLSGGETFLVSLSLALALSAEICARSLRPIEFFFLDEGFGTLDERLVDTVMDSLEKLKGEHFSIGIISHVEELRHRINRKLSVRKATDRHGSQITME